MNANVASVTATNTATLTNKTLTLPLVDGTPVATGKTGRDATSGSRTTFDNSMFGFQSRVVAAGVGTQTLINSTAADQDFTALFQIPANSLFTGKIFFVSVLIECITTAAAITLTNYLKLGSTKICSSVAFDAGAATRSILLEFVIDGGSTPGASANVACFICSSLSGAGTGSVNNISQPVGSIATNGPLDIVLGITYSGTGSTESMELQAWSVEELG